MYIDGTVKPVRGYQVMAKDLAERIAEADARGSDWLARFNKLDEAGRGDTQKAQQCLERCQKWVDKSNELRRCGPL